jgi:hypothetical protein
MRLRPEEEQIPLPAGTVPALVGAETWALTKQMRARNQRLSPRNNKKHFFPALLRYGFARCASCGGSMMVAAAAGGTFNYQCAGVGKKTCTAPTSIRGASLDEAVWARMVRVLEQPDLIATEIDKLDATDPTAGLIEITERQIQRNAADGRALVNRLVGASPQVGDLIMEKLAQLDTRTTALQAELVDIATRRQAWAASHAFFDQVEEWCAQAAHKLHGEQVTFAIKRDFVEAFDIKVVVHRPGEGPRWEMTWDAAIGEAPGADFAIRPSCSSDRKIGLRVYWNSDGEGPLRL